MSNQHTATPYTAGHASNGPTVMHGHMIVADCFDAGALAQENAAFIVRACNAHDALLAALREAEALIPELVRQLTNGAPMSVAAAHDRIRAAIAKAEGRTVKTCPVCGNDASSDCLCNDYGDDAEGE